MRIYYTYILPLCLYLLCISACHPFEDYDPQSQGFVKLFGGPGLQEGKDMVATNDGFLLLGTSSSFGDQSKDIYLVKTDLNGIQQWQKNFGGPGDDKGIAIQPSGADFIILSQEQNSDKISNIVLRKVDTQGRLLAIQTIGDSTFQTFHSEAQALAKVDNGFLVIGTTSAVDSSKFGASTSDDLTDFFIALAQDEQDRFKVDWQRVYGNLEVDRGADAIEFDNGYLVLGTTQFAPKANDSSDNFRLIQLDDQGRLIDARLIGDNTDFEAKTLFKQDNNTILLAGAQDDKALVVPISNDFSSSDPLETPSFLGAVQDMAISDDDELLLAGSSLDNGLMYLAVGNASDQFQDNKIQYFGDAATSTTHKLINLGKNRNGENEVAIFGTLQFGANSNQMMILIKTNISTERIQ